MKKRNDKKAAPGGIVTVSVFLTIILGFGAASIICPDREFSDMENRRLQQAPEFSLKRLRDGTFTSDIEKYMSDQIFLKDQLVGLRTAADRALAKSYLNGVYFGKDGYYLQDFQLNEEMIRKNMGCLTDFAETVKGSAEVSMLLAPNSISVLSEKLPGFTQTDDQRRAVAIAEEMAQDGGFESFFCPLAFMQENEDKDSFYYRTDHHWTDAGARAAYDLFLDSQGKPTVPAPESYKELPGFLGTLYSKAPQTGVRADTVYLPECGEVTVSYISPAADHQVPAECEEQEGVSWKSGLYAAEPMETKDKYAAIMGGNFALCEIETSADSDESILILKDSYANAVLPYLCRNYRHISLIDLRYYHMEERTVSEYLKEKGIQKVLCIYNIDFLNSDNNFVWLE